MGNCQSAWIPQIDRADGIDTLIWIGAGDAKDLPVSGKIQIRRIVLVEPDPLHLPALERLAARDPRISVHPIAIHTADGQARLHQFNWSALTGLLVPDGLSTMYPGLRQTGTCDVATMKMDTFLAEECLDFSATTLLRLDAPEVGDIVSDALSGLTPANVLHVLMRYPVLPLYARGRSADDLLDQLVAHDFRLLDRDSDDMDFVNFWFRYDPDQNALRQERDEAKAESGALRAQLATVESFGQLVKADLDELRERYRQKWLEVPPEPDPSSVAAANHDSSSSDEP